MKRALVSCFLVLLVGVAALAQGTDGSSPVNPAPGAVSVRGHLDKDLYCIDLQINQIASPQRYPGKVIEGIKIYTEPSHTLMAVFTDPTVSLTEAARVTMTGPIGGSRPTLCTREGLPAGDTRAVVVVVTPDGESKLVDAEVNLADFAFSVTPNANPNLPPLEFCCVCQGCRNCLDWCPQISCVCPGCIIRSGC